MKQTQTNFMNNPFDGLGRTDAEEKLEQIKIDANIDKEEKEIRELQFDALHSEARRR